MPHTRRRATATLLGLATWLAFSASWPAHAQDASYPSKPIHLVVTFPPGGSTDAVVRIIAPRLAERLGQQVLVDNRPGAGGNIGLSVVAKADPDGYTLGVGAAGALSANASLYEKMPFDVTRDFAPISLLAHIPFVLATNASSSVKSLEQALAGSRAAPGSLAVGHGGNGTAMHLSIQLIKQMAQVQMNDIAYRGSGPAAVDLLGGQIPLAMLDLPSALAHIRAGTLKALAVTSDKRLSFLPDVPTLAEAGLPGYVSTGWFGVVAPAGTPPAVLARLQREFTAVLSDPQAVAAARNIGVDLAPTSAEAFGSFIRSETQKWGDVIRTSGTKLK
jgi:tripartite-type tricarboxylate transporter receptor subunit TctC